MKYLELCHRRRALASSGLAAISLFGLSALGCNNGDTSGGQGEPFVETFDEGIEDVPPQPRGRSGGAPQALDEGGRSDVGGAPVDAAGKGGSVEGVGRAAGPDGPESAGRSSGLFVPSALWHFDDCSPATKTLLDSSGNGLHATRTANVGCAEGIAGLGVAFDEPGDRIEAANAQPLRVHQNLAVAAWVNPTSTDGNRPVVLKRRNNETAFSLRVQKGQIQFTVTLDSGQTVTSAAPIAANQWSHVAGLYDGRFVFLFLNGEQVGQVFAEGAVRDVDAPLRIGATTQTQRFVGRIDDVVVSTQPATPADLLALACLRGPGSLTVEPEVAGPLAPGSTAIYGVTVHNSDVGFCAPRSYLLFAEPPPDFNAFGEPFFSPEVPPGGDANFSLVVTSSDEAEPQVATIPFFIINAATAEVSGQVLYEVAGQDGCQVSTARELLVRHLSVVDDPLRTTFTAAPPGDPRRGAWTFGRLMTDMAPSPEVAPEFVEQVFDTWLSAQTVNTFDVPPRPAMQSLVLASWPRLPDGRLDLERSPLQLQAVVNRVDLRDLANGDAGEGRFVFGVLAPAGFPLPFTVILEYKLPASTEADVLDWAQRWHALSEQPFPSPAFNDALQAITDRFAGRGAAPGSPNGSALAQLRTNEIALTSPWELREFHFGPDGFLRPASVALTPDGSFNFGDRLARFVNENEAAILTERHAVPASFEGAPFAAGAVLNNIDFWSAPGITNNEARHKLSLNTCNGCHGAETGTGFLHVSPRFPGFEASLSGFMTGTAVADPVTGQSRQFNDLARRRADLRALVCAPEPSAAAGVNLRKGISRAHLNRPCFDPGETARPLGHVGTPPALTAGRRDAPTGSVWRSIVFISRLSRDAGPHDARRATARARRRTPSSS
jgi:Concanavalin A-like lectin/glucanases superfamily